MRLKLFLPIALAMTCNPQFIRADPPEPPEYMRLNPQVGKSFEIKGVLNEDGLFEADEMIPLEEARKPKLRAPIQALDAAQKTIRVLGMTIGVTDETEFDAGSWQDLRVGQQIEVKCSIRESGWEAAAIETKAIKPSVKVKVTITGMSCDGAAPDTLDASGFLILLTPSTDAEQATRQPNSRERRLFRELAYDDAAGLQRGSSLAQSRVHVMADYRQNYESETDHDLSPTFDADNESTEPQIRLLAAAYPTPQVRALTQLRLRQDFLLHAPDGEPSPELEFDLLQLSVLVRDIADEPIAVQVGRQRYKEPRQWLYDEYLDAARVSYYPWRRFSLEGSLIDGRHSAKDKFETWTDAVGLVTVGLGDGLASAYLWKRFDRDEQRNREPLWAGVRYDGEPLSWVDGWADGAIMRGEDKYKSLRAWAFDIGGVASTSALPWRPSASLSYAAGSGNPPEADGDDHEFRQTGYEDNSARWNGLSHVRYYGALLDPELANLTVFTAGAGVSPREWISVEGLYHRYRQYHPDTELRSELIDPPARPNGSDPELGDGFDLVWGLSDLWGRVTAAWTLAWFFPGAAYAPREETAFLHRFELRVTL